MASKSNRNSEEKIKKGGSSASKYKQEDYQKDIEQRAKDMAKTQGALDTLLAKQQELQKKMSQAEKLAAKISTLRNQLSIYDTGRSATRKVLGLSETDKDIEADIKAAEKVIRQIDSLEKTYAQMQSEVTKLSSQYQGVQEAISRHKEEVAKLQEAASKNRLHMSSDFLPTSYLREAKALREAAKELEQGSVAYAAAMRQAETARRKAVQMMEDRKFEKAHPSLSANQRVPKISAQQLKQMSLEQIAKASPQSLPKGFLRSTDVELEEDDKGKHAYNHTSAESKKLDRLIKSKKLRQVSASRVATNYEGYSDDAEVDALLKELSDKHAKAAKGSSEQYKVAAQYEKLLRQKISLGNTALSGNAYHKLVELVENGTASKILNRKVSSSSSLSGEDIRALALSPEGAKLLQGLRLKNVKAGRGAELPTISELTVDEALKGDIAQQLPNSLRTWDKQKKQLKIKRVLGTEVAKGGLYNTGNQVVEAVGTADMLVEYEDGSIGVLDHKTSANLHKRPVSIQNAIGKRLQGVEGHSSVSNVPFKGKDKEERKGVAAVVGDLTDEELSEVIDDYIAGRTKTVRNYDKISQKFSSTTAKFDLKGLPQQYGKARKEGSAEKFVEEIIKQISSLPEDEQQAIIGSLFDTHHYEGATKTESSSYYRKGEIFDILREKLPSKYRDILTGANVASGNIGRNFTSTTKPDGTTISGSTYGGAWLSDYVKLVKVRAKEMTDPTTSKERWNQLELEIKNIIDTLVSSVQLGGGASDANALLTAIERRDDYKEGDELEEGAREGWDWFIRAFDEYGKGLTHSNVITGEGHSANQRTSWNDDYHFKEDDNTTNNANTVQREKGAFNAYSREQFQQLLSNAIVAFGGTIIENENGEKNFGFQQHLKDDTQITVDKATAQGLISLLKSLEEVYTDASSNITREGERNAEGSYIDSDNNIFVADQITRLAHNLQRRIDHKDSNLHFEDEATKNKIKKAVDNLVSGGDSYLDSVNTDGNRLAWAIEGPEYYEKTFAGQLNELNKGRKIGAPKVDLANSGLLLPEQQKQYESFKIVKKVFDDWEKAQEPIERLFELLGQISVLDDDSMDGLVKSVSKWMRVNPQGYSEDVAQVLFSQLSPDKNGLSHKQNYWNSASDIHPESERVALLGGDIIRTGNRDAWNEVPALENTQEEVLTLNQYIVEWREKLKRVTVEIADYKRQLANLNKDSQEYRDVVLSLKDAVKEQRELYKRLYKVGDPYVAQLAVDNRAKQKSKASNDMLEAWKTHYNSIPAVKGSRKSRVKTGASAAAYFDRSFSDEMLPFLEEAQNLKNQAAQGESIEVNSVFNQMIKQWLAQMKEETGQELTKGFKNLFRARIELLSQEVLEERDKYLLQAAKDRKKEAAKLGNPERRKIINENQTYQRAIEISERERERIRATNPREPFFKAKTEVSEEKVQDSVETTAKTLTSATEEVKSFTSAVEDARAPVVTLTEIIKNLPSYFGEEEIVSPQSIPATPQKRKGGKRNRREENPSVVNDNHVIPIGEGGPYDKRGKRLVAEMTGANGEQMASIYKVAKEIQKASWSVIGYDSAQSFIKAKGDKGVSKNKEARNITETEIRKVLATVDGYTKASGDLNARGKSELDSLMRAIYGEKYTGPQQLQTNKIVINGAPPTVTITGASANIVAPNLSNTTSGSTSRGFGGFGSSKGFGGGGSSSSNSLESVKEYIDLLRQISDLNITIHDTEQKREILRRKGESTDKSTEEIQNLMALRDSIQRHADSIEQNNSQNWSPKQKTQIGDTLAILGNRETYKEGKSDASYELEQQIKSEKELEGLLGKRLGYERQIYAAQHQIAISISGQEKAALGQVISMTTEEINLIDEKIQRLHDSGLLRHQELSDILRQYQIQQQQLKATEGAKNHGSQSIWDMMKYDIKRSFTRVFDYGVAMQAIAKARQGLTKIIQIVQQLDSALTSLRIVTGLNKKEAEYALITYNRLGKELHATTQEVAESATTWLRQGYSVEEASTLISASMKLSKLAFMDASTATQTLTSAIKGFKLEVNQIDEVVDKLTKIDAAAAVTAQGISEALQLIANSAQMAGYTLDEAIGMVSAIGEVTQQSMSTVGNAVKTLMARFGNVKAGAFGNLGEGSEETTENINDIEKVLRVVGISIRTSTFEMRQMGDVLDDLSKKWVSLDSVTKNAIATAMAGTRQRENFNVLMNNYDRYKELVEESENAAGTADAKFEAYADSFEALTKDMQNAWEELVQKIQASPLVKGGMKFLTKLMEILPKITPMIAALGTQFMTLKAPEWFPKIKKKVITPDFKKGLYQGLTGKSWDKKYEAENEVLQTKIKQAEATLRSGPEEGETYLRNKLAVSKLKKEETALREKYYGSENQKTDPLLVATDKQTSVLSQIRDKIDKIATKSTEEKQISSETKQDNQNETELRQGIIRAKQLSKQQGAERAREIAIQREKEAEAQKIIQKERNFSISRKHSKAGSMEEALDQEEQDYQARQAEGQAYLAQKQEKARKGKERARSIAEQKRWWSQEFDTSKTPYQQLKDTINGDIPLQLNPGRSSWSLDEIVAYDLNREAEIEASDIKRAEDFARMARARQGKVTNKEYIQYRAEMDADSEELNRARKSERALKGVLTRQQKAAAQASLSIPTGLTDENLSGIIYTQEDVKVENTQLKLEALQARIRQLEDSLSTRRREYEGYNIIRYDENGNASIEEVGGLNDDLLQLEEDAYNNEFDRVRRQRQLTRGPIISDERIIPEGTNTTSESIATDSLKNSIQTLNQTLQEVKENQNQNTGALQESTKEANELEAAIEENTQRERTGSKGKGEIDSPADNPASKPSYLEKMGGKVGITSKILGGAAAGFAAGSAKTTVGDDGSFLGGLISKAAGTEGVSVAADMGDKVIKGVSTGVVSAGLALIPGVGPILSSTLGPIIGGAIGDLITFGRHSEELARKARVKAAEEELEALGKMDAPLKELYNIADSSYLTSAQLISLNENMVEILGESANSLTFTNSLLKNLSAELKEDFTSLTDVQNKLLTGTREERKEIVHQMEVSQALAERDALMRSQEEARYEENQLMRDDSLVGGFGGVYLSSAESKLLQESGLTENMHLSGAGKLITGLAAMGGGAPALAAGIAGGISSANHVGLTSFNIEGSDAAERHANSIKLLNQLRSQKDVEVSSDLINEVEKAAKKYSEMAAKIQKLNAELVKADTQVGIVASRIKELSDVQLQGMTTEAAIQKIADAMQEQGIAVRSVTGAIKAQYRAQIESMVEQDEELRALTSGAGKSLNALTKAQSDFKKKVIDKADLGKDFLISLGIDESEFDNMDKVWAKLNDAMLYNATGFKDFAENIGLSVDELRSLIGLSSDEYMRQLASAIGFTTDKLKEMKDILGGVDLEEALESASDSRARYDEYFSIYEDLLANGTLSQENLEKVMSSMPELSAEYVSGNLLNYLENIMSGPKENRQDLMYKQKMMASTWGQASIYKQFQEKSFNVNGQEKSGADLIEAAKGRLNEEQLEVLSKATSFQDIQNLLPDLMGDESVNAALEEFMKQLNVTWETSDPLRAKLNDEIINQLDKQLENLEAQKEAISAINNQRQKELDYVKAQIALENASKEKKKVYREGLGFTYEEDSQTVNDAQKKLDELDAQREEERLELQIEGISLQKEALEFAAQEVELLTQLNAAQDYMRKHGLTDENQAFNYLTADNAKEGTGNMWAWFSDEGQKKFALNQEKASKLMEVGTAFKELANAEASYQEILKNNPGDYKAIAEAMDAVNEAKVKYDNAMSGASVAGVTSQDVMNERANNWDLGSDGNVKDLYVKDENDNYSISDDESKKIYIDATGQATADITQMGALNWTEKLKDVIIKGADGNNYKATTTPADYDQFSDDSETEVWKYNPQTGELDSKQSLASFNAGRGDNNKIGNDHWGNLSTVDPYTVLINRDKANRAAYVGPDHKLYSITKMDGDEWTDMGYATGTLGLSSGTPVLLNELGTEAIITPQGTVTALPSKTGIVPADITKNLWALGEAAPNLVSRLSSLNLPGFNSNNSTTHNDGTFIDTLNMTIYPTKDYDMDKFIREAKARAKISNHNN